MTARPHQDGDYLVDSNACWIWQKGLSIHGYGKCKRKGASSPHRWYYQQLVGPVPAGMQLDHLCKVKACVNPAHLEPVTPSENVRRSSMRRLTEEQVLQIREATGPQAKIAEEFGVNQSLVCRIKQRKIWRMIDEHDRSESLVEHPVVQPWEDLGQMLRPGHKVNAERPPEAPLAEHLAARRALAVEVAKVAHAVIVACDQHPAPYEAERARDPLSRVIEGGQDDREAAA